MVIRAPVDRRSGLLEWKRRLYKLLQGLICNNQTKWEEFMILRDPTQEMVIERDLPIAMDDELVLRADVYRPKTDLPVPVIMTSGPYGKGVMYQDHYKVMWEWLIAQHPGLLPGSTRSFLTWETVDPEIWVPWGYAVVRVDSRGACRSPGLLDIFSPRESRDYYNAIEWAGTRPWSNGKVGLNGISYYAINQWHVAQLQPPHLTARPPTAAVARQPSSREIFAKPDVGRGRKTRQVW
jgi:uncharacterized protein